MLSVALMQVELSQSAHCTEQTCTNVDSKNIIRCKTDEPFEGEYFGQTATTLSSQTGFTGEKLGW